MSTSIGFTYRTALRTNGLIDGRCRTQEDELVFRTLLSCVSSCTLYMRELYNCLLYTHTHVNEGGLALGNP